MTFPSRTQTVFLLCRSRLRRVLTPLAFLIGLFLSVAAIARADVSDKRFFDVPAGVAERTLKLFSTQAGRGIIMDADAVAGIRTNSVKGEYEPKDAVQRMLQGTQLTAVQDPQSGSFVVNHEGRSPRNPAANPRGADEGSLLTGTLAGRVSHAQSGNYLNNATVSVVGTSLQTFTDPEGAYRFLNVPIGPVQISASFSGLGAVTRDVVVMANTTRTVDFELRLIGTPPHPSGQVIALETFTVQERELTSQGVALQERQNAPNLKNVIALEEDMGEGNVGEYLKYVPGIALDLNPQSPAFASIRGMPNSGTLVMTDGADIASSGVSGRAVDLGLAAAGNIDRIEITKVPTPDMPANAVGGSINMITKSAFSRKKPLFAYNAFATYTTPQGFRDGGPGAIFDRSDGPDGKSNMNRVNPAVNLSYLYPVNRSFGLTLSLSHSNRYTDWDFRRPGWDKVRGLKTSDNINHLPFGEEKTLAALKAEWKAWNDHTFSASVSYSNQDLFTRQNPFTTTFGTNFTGGENFSQGAATGVGTASMAASGNNQDKTLALFSFGHRYTGRTWKFEANASFSESEFAFTDVSDGFFGSLSARIQNLVLRSDFFDTDDRRAPAQTAFNRAGAAVDLYDGNRHSLVSAGSNERTINDRFMQANLHLSREFLGQIPLTVKVGAAVSKKRNEDDAGARSWAFTPPGGAAAQIAGNYDLIANEFSNVNFYTDINGQPVRIKYLSLEKLKTLYDANPAWFVLDQTAAHVSKSNLTKEIEETISAGYVRLDSKFFDNRLLVVSGVRFEQTRDNGRGGLNDIRRTYQQDGNGNLLLDPQNRPMRITTNALENARLQYTVLGNHSVTSYGDFYPSINLAYSVTPKIVARAAYARTIGRPNFSEIIPGLTITDPGASDGSRTITAINSALKPWTANNYDLSLELYGIKNVVASVSGFRKEITGFFNTTRYESTVEGLAEIGLPDDYLGYEIITKRNGGQATISGIEVEYRQLLTFLPGWARGTQIFGNLTSMDLSGPNENDFSGFTSKTGNWGVSFSRGRFNARVGVNYTGTRRLSSVASSATVRPNSYNYYAPQTRVDASFDLMISRNYSIYGDVRNLQGAPLRRGTWSPDTPEHAKFDVVQNAGTLFTVGVKGRF